MGFFSINWGSSGKTPPVQVCKDNAGNTTYKLTDHDLGTFQDVCGAYGAQNMLTLFQSIPEVFSPVNIIASRVAKGRFTLRNKKTDDEILDNKAWNRLSKKPNWRQTFQHFVYNCIVYKKMTGNRYFFKQMPATTTQTNKIDNITSIWLLPPQYTEPILRGDRTRIYAATEPSDFVKYYQCTWDGTQNIDPKFVIHDADMDFGNEISNSLKGWGVIRASKFPMSNLVAVYQARNVIYVKKGALGAIVSKKEDSTGSVALTKTEKKNIRDEINSDYGLTGGRDIYAVTDVPVDFVRFSMSIEELQPFEETKSSALTIYSNLDVPRSFCPTIDNINYNNGPADERKLYDDVVINEGEIIANILTELLGVEADGNYIHVDYSHVAALQEDKGKEADTFNKIVTTNISLYKDNLITKNQLLVAIGLPEETGGDVRISDIKGDPMAVKLGVGGLQALQNFLTSGMEPEQLKQVLIIVFGVPEADAAKLISNDNSTNNTGKTGNEDQGTEEQKPAV